MSTVLKPYALLQEIEARSRRKALGLPQQVEVRKTWTGVGFRIGDVYLLATLAEVNEILISPEMTRVPNALAWVKGIANIRGMLLPVMDLKGFIDGDSIQKGRKTRVLLIQKGDLVSGLMVDEVFGMRHFFEEERCEAVPEASDNLSKYIKSAFQQRGQHWGVFDMDYLTSDSRFLDVALT